jgi:hypothetical protein
MFDDRLRLAWSLSMKSGLVRLVGSVDVRCVNEKPEVLFLIRNEMINDYYHCQ